jgi:enamine deaminase RidA (YjgF/YER057c/UK114 family)
MSAIESKLTAKGLTIPALRPPVGNYVPFTRSGNILFLAGQVAAQDGKIVSPGTVGKDVTIEQANTAARVAALNALAVIKSAVGDLDNVVRILRAVVYVSSTPDFTQQPLIANGASDLLVEVFGEAGRHARSAIGLSSLPLGSPVEVELTVEVR